MCWGVVFCLFSVILGAFSAHALKGILTDSHLSSFETGVRYQMYHGLTLLLLGLNSDKLHQSILSARLMIYGTLLFSGSIYLLNLQALIGISLPFLGPITPIGGFFLISGWSILLISLIKKTK